MPGPGLPTSRQLVDSTSLVGGHGSHIPEDRSLRSYLFVRLRDPTAGFTPAGVGRREKEKNGYPFTTFTDLSDFLGIVLGVLSDDLATMLILY